MRPTADTPAATVRVHPITGDHHDRTAPAAAGPAPRRGRPLAPHRGHAEKKKVAIGCSIGATIETYDFIGFGTAAALYFNKVFFPATDPLSGTLLSFATLGIGFAVRPLGGIIGGYLGDKIGRKPVLVGSLLLMGIATVLIGALPTYQQVGSGPGSCWSRASGPGPRVRRRMGRGDPHVL